MKKKIFLQKIALLEKTGCVKIGKFCEIDKFAIRKNNVKREVVLCFTYSLRII